MTMGFCKYMRALTCIFLLLPPLIYTDDGNSNDSIAIAHEYCELAQALYKENKKESAIIYFRKAIAHDTNHIKAYQLLGNSLRDLDKMEEAIPYYKKALSIESDNIITLLELANTLNMLDQTDEALTYYVKALEINPIFPAALHNFAFTLKKKGHVHEAIEVFEKLLKRYPNYSLGRFNLSTAYLSIGDFERGWDLYESRWEAYNESPKRFESPLWDGIADLNKKTIIVYAEQGYGDTFQFIRYLPLLKEKGARIIFETQAALYDILKLCPYIDQLITSKSPKVTADYHIPLMTLPLLFKTRVDTVPATIPYLYAQPQLVQYWKNRLAHDQNIKVGICWHGNGQYPTQSLRKAVEAKSIPLRMFAQIAEIPGVSLYSLQKVDGTSEIVNAGFTIHDFGDEFDTKNGRFMDTAAIMKHLDLVLTIDTSIVHLAGGLGVKTILLLPNPADWRWIVKQDYTPWYPSMKLFIQDEPHAWEPVINDVAHYISNMLNEIQHKRLNATVRDLEVESVIASALKKISSKEYHQPAESELERKITNQLQTVLAQSHNS